jgi:predicted ATPase
MEIKYIELTNYKSIKNTNKIHFSSPFITFVGKNGSGKTNILEALFILFDQNQITFRKNMNFKFHIQINHNEFKKFNLTKELTSDETLIEAYSSKENNHYRSNIDYIKSNFLTRLLRTTEDSIYSLSKELETKLLEFKDLVNDLYEKDDHTGNSFAKLMSYDGDLSQSDQYGFMFHKFLKEIDEAITKVNETIKTKVKSNEIQLSFNRLYIFKSNIKNDFQLKYEQPKLTKFEQRHVIVNEDGIKKEIDVINEKLSKNLKAIHQLQDKLDKKLDNFISLLYDSIDSIDEDLSSTDLILKRIVLLCNPKVYFLSNDNNMSFFRNNSRYSYYPSFSESNIIQTFMTYKFSTNEQNDFYKRLQENTITKKEKDNLICELQTFMNEHLPEFEKDMIKGIKVSNDLKFSIIEKTGEEISFEHTNAGRKWFFTYFFIKGCLRKGDILILDEPANSLHPEAQIKIKEELVDISKHNKVIITTHSPYMISADSLVYYVRMGEEGTEINDTNNFDIHEIAEKLNIFSERTIIGDYLINNELLSFEEIGNRINELLKEHKIKRRDVAEKLNCDESYVGKKLKGEHLTYQDVSWFVKQYNFNPMRLLLKNYKK